MAEIELMPTRFKSFDVQGKVLVIEIIKAFILLEFQELELLKSSLKETMNLIKWRNKYEFKQ